jgi:hypothetical protein
LPFVRRRSGKDNEIAPDGVEIGAHLALLEDRDEGRRRFYEGYESRSARTSFMRSPSCSAHRRAWM